MLALARGLCPGLWVQGLCGPEQAFRQAREPDAFLVYRFQPLEGFLRLVASPRPHHLIKRQIVP